MMRASARSFFVGLVAVVTAVPAGAQKPRGADTMSHAAVADSQQVLRELDQHIRVNPKDAAAWYRRGMVGWSLYDRAKAKNPPRGLDHTRLGRLADTSLRIAAELDPNSARYRTAVGRFLLESGFAVVRFGAATHFEKALEIGRRGGDSNNYAEAAVEYARVYWRRYDALANRRIETTPGSAFRSISQAMRPTEASADAAVADASEDGWGRSDLAGSVTEVSLKSVQEAIDRGTQALPPEVTGESDYVTSGKLFAEAYAANPRNARAFQSMVMHMAERSKWSEVEAFARTHLEQIPWDPWAWVALGLATHRLGDSKTAAAAFDSAMVYIEPTDRARLDRLDRVLRPTDTARIAKGSNAERAAVGRMYWLLADPLWSRSGNESRVEYFARVAFAEFRWSVEELNIRGADTDRGNIYIRYGPPDITVVFGPAPGMPESNITTIWIYRTGLMFSFSGQPTFASAETPLSDRLMTETITATIPVRWDNLSNFTVDSLPTQIMRFRAGRDSVDVVVALDPPVDSIRASTSLSDAPSVRGDYWLLAGAALLTHRDSITLDGAGVRTWSARVAQGAYLLRAEASVDGGMRAARSASAVQAGDDATSGFALRGFGMSDVLVASRAEPRQGIAQRWSDLDIEPVVRSLPRASPLALVWENYELGNRDGLATYTVAIDIKRERSLAGAIATRIAGGLASAARIERISDDEVAMRIDRSLPHADAFVDHITIELGDTPPGSYQLTLRITDAVTGQSRSRTTRFVVRR